MKKTLPESCGIFSATAGIRYRSKVIFGFAFSVLALSLFLSNFTQQANAMGGPGGVGNTLGTNGQPRLVLWLDASAVDPSEGPSLFMWSDISGNGNHALMPFTEQRPQLADNFLNGHPVIRFQAAQQQYFELDGSLLTATDLTVMYVGARSNAGYNMVLGGSRWGDDNRNLHMGWDNDGLVANHFGNDIYAAASGGDGSGINDFGIFANRLASEGQSPARRFFQNGLMTGSVNNRNRLLSYEGAAIARNNGIFYDVDVAEMIFFNTAINEAASRIINTYLSVKYGLIPDDGPPLFAHQEYYHDLTGIGTTDGQEKHSATSGSGGGLYLREANNSLDQVYEFIFAAHNNLPNVITTADIGLNDIADSRWSRSWYLKRIQGGVEGAGNTDIRLGFNFTEGRIPLQEGNIYALLYRASVTDDFLPVAGQLSMAQGSTVWFNVNDNQLQSGYYTIGEADLVPTTWYTYKNGSWDDHTTWTTNPSGTVMEGPAGVFPGPLDKAVILPSNIVTVTSNEIRCQVLEVQQGATLDLQGTSGHTFYSVTGEGTIRLRTSSFPQGNYDAFAETGTVEFYGSDLLISNEYTFNNVVVNLDQPSESLVLTNNLNLNGNLNIVRGNLRINDNEGTTPLTLTINGNLSVAANGSIRVGTGNTATGYNIPGSLPAAGSYHDIFHKVILKGNFTNQGQVRFTNQTAPVYNQFSTTGAATIIFSGHGNSLASLMGITDFYNIVVNKGNDRNTILEINASDPAHFALFGPNNLGVNTESPFSQEHPELRKALWVRSGTLKLTGSINIPSLTEGSAAGGRGEYFIGSRSGLWIDGSNVQVHTTIANAGQLPQNATGFSEQASQTGLELYGTLKVSAGYLGTRHSSGLVYYPQSLSRIMINGGILEVSMIYTGGGATGQTWFSQSGGTLLIRGDRGPDGADMVAGIPVLGIRNPFDVFEMSGGVIRILHPNNNNGLLIASDTENLRITGGSIELDLHGQDLFPVQTTAPLGNISITRSEGSDPVKVYLKSPLTVLSDLLIGDHCELHSKNPLLPLSTEYNLNIGRNLTVGQSPDLNTARYVNLANTTTFYGPQEGVINIVNTSFPDVVSFFNWVIDKDDPQITITLVSEGRTPVYSPPFFSPVGVQNSLVVKKGILDYNTFPVVLHSQTFVENHGTIGLIDDPGFIVFTNAYINQKLKIPNKGEPFFGQILLDNSHGLTLQGKATLNVGTLKMKQGIFDIGNETLVIHRDLLAVSGSSFSSSMMIRTAGQHTDGGLVRLIAASGQYLYPLGTSRDNRTRYTPARPTFSEVSDSGFVQINNVGQELATLFPSNRAALQYYWRVRFSGFEQVPGVANHFVFHPDDINLNNNNRRAGKIINLVRAYYDHGINNNQNIIEYDPLILEAGEFTMGHADRFAGNVRVYYTRDHGSSTGGAAREPRWHDRHTWTRSDLTGFDPQQPHRSSNPALSSDNDVPGSGDIVVIGWVPWDDPKVALRGQPHGVWIDNNTQEAAEVHFTQMLDQDGDPTAKVYRSNFQFRPTLCINNTGGQLNTAVVSGEGLFWCRMNSQPNFEAMDIREFAEQDSSYVLYENFQANATYGFTPPLFPNLMISNDGWGSNNHDIRFTNDIATTGNFEILGNINLLLNDGETGDFHIGRDLIMFEYHGSEGDSSGGGAEISYNHTGTTRRIVVGGDLVMRNRGSMINIRNIASGTNIIHHLEVHGDIIQDSHGANPNGLRFYLSGGRPRISLTMSGDKDGTFQVVSGAVPNLFNLRVNKGKNTAFLNSVFVLNASAGAINKPLELISGTTVINNAGLDLLVNNGGPDFPIPSGASLELLQGKIRITGVSTGIALQGKLALHNQSQAIIESTANDNYIEFGASGNASLEIHNDALLRVGSQVRSSVVSDQGSLRYRQTGGQVFLGTQVVPEVSRGVLEIQNTGSEFSFTGGELTIARAHGVFPARQPLYLNPSFSNVSPDAVIRLGYNDSPENQIIELYSSTPLPSVWVDNSIPVRAIATNSLTFAGDLIIGTDNALSASGHNITFLRDLHNQGNASLFADTVFFSGATQQISGNAVFNRLILKPTEEVILQAGNASWDVQGNFHLFDGVLIDGGNTIDVRGQIFNQAIHSSSNPDAGGLRLSGSSLQNIYGNGTFGRLELDNGSGARIHGPMRLDNHLTLTNGVFSISGFRLTMGPNAEILGSGFGPHKMIRTNGIFEDRGIRKHVTAGSGEFMFPFGANNKFNPATLNWSANSNPGTVDITPVDMPHVTFTGEQVLRYYWYIESQGLSNFSGNLLLQYNQSEVEGNDSEYIAARLHNNEWSRFSSEFVDHQNNTILFAGLSVMEGEYTAGLDDEIPENVPLLISQQNGDFRDKNSWIHAGGGEVPIGGPNGHRILILPEHTITIYDDQRVTYQAEIRGRLEVETTIMHNFGTLYGTGTLAINSGVLPAGRLDMFFTCSGGTMEYGGPHDLHISPRFTTFRNLTLTGQGMKALPAAGIMVCNNLKVLQQAHMRATHNITLMGDFTMEATASAEFSNDFIMSGSNPQNVWGDVIAGNAFHNLELNNSAGVTFHGNAEVNQVLYLRHGTAYMQDDNFMQLNNIYGLSFTANAQRDNFIQGRLIRRLSPGGGQNIFPIGRNSMMRNLFISSPATSTASYWDASYYDHNASLNGMFTTYFNFPLLSVSSREFWRVEGPDNSSALIGLSWGAESGIDPDFQDGVAVAAWDGGAWTDKGSSAVVTGNNGTVHSGVAASFSVRHFTFASYEANDPLPIELLSFTASASGNVVTLNWVTASEINNDFFTIERSSDGLNFQPVAYVQSQAAGGYSTQNLYYEITDTDPLEGRSYYRLKQTDFDGTYDHSHIVEVMLLSQRDVSMVLFPNPSRGKSFNIALSDLSPFGELNITVTSISGRVVHYEKATADTSGTLLHTVNPPGTLPKGVYIITVSSLTERISTRLVVQ